MLPADWLAMEWWATRSRAVERMVLGVVRARQLHPQESILLDGVDTQLFWAGVVHHPFRVFGVSDVYLTPGSDRYIEPHSDAGRVSDYTLPSESTVNGLNENRIVVYRIGPQRLKAITSQYSEMTAPNLSREPPRRVDAGNPLMSYLLGPEWYSLEDGSRWMPRRATLCIGAPPSPSEKLHLSGFCSDDQLRAGPLPVRIAVDGIPLSEFKVSSGANQFHVILALPSHLVGTKWLDLTVEAGRSFRAGQDGRDISLSFGTFEIRD